MLESLYISNYALIDETDITFHPGLNIITGETGAGKSIILGALSMLLGARADIKKAATNGKKSIVEAQFKIDSYPELRSFFNDNDIDYHEDGTCILRREISPTGRTRSFINDTPVSLSQLQEITEHLTDIHSQHQNQLLSRPEFQLKVIDTLANNEGLLTEYEEKYNNFRLAFRKLKKTKARIERSRNDEDFLRFQMEQFENADLREGELEELEKQHEILSNLSELKNALFTALEVLTNGNSNAIDLIDTAKTAYDNIADKLNDEENISSRLESLKIELKDIASSITSEYTGLSTDTSEIELIEERINKLKSLLRKHNASDIGQLIETYNSIKERLEILDQADSILSRLEKEAKHYFSAAKEASHKLSLKRQEAAKEFESILLERAIPLGMKNLRCEVKIEPTEMSSTGMDKIAFNFAFNKNQELTAVGGNASGGEISRLMLCIKSIIADKINLPTVIFDEIDTGVSGEIASKIGDMMKGISKSIQVISITHLPQVASKGDHHYKVYKTDDELTTHTRINELDKEGRINELTTMLSGGNDREAARANAISLIEASH